MGVFEDDVDPRGFLNNAASEALDPDLLLVIEILLSIEEATALPAAPEANDIFPLGGELLMEPTLKGWMLGLWTLAAGRAYETSLRRPARVLDVGDVSSCCSEGWSDVQGSTDRFVAGCNAKLVGSFDADGLWGSS